MLRSAAKAAWCSLLWAVAAQSKLRRSSAAQHCSTASRQGSGSSNNKHGADSSIAILCSSNTWKVCMGCNVGQHERRITTMKQAPELCEEGSDNTAVRETHVLPHHDTAYHSPVLRVLKAYLAGVLGGPV